ncbi:hypothetical protein [Chelatococcus asaccharovorans]|uniref:Uncharacterized protein n=1 Tax=Chelatococcus asaccharovorans TaxID=28210 RepID=A0A2V3UDR5_9HYPH|nr:hypothetical protein [Chelatococcus asaccharovorans]MBS7703323.1 hypothetical protein [Chelatococcus asaccharovorans]PXW61656.1 hypothetical protein C7450_103173 [Chelatococcus asaccharovorans]
MATPKKPEDDKPYEDDAFYAVTIVKPADRQGIQWRPDQQYPSVKGLLLNQITDLIGEARKL